MSLTKLSLAGIIKFFPARESLVSDIPAGDGKTADLFDSVVEGGGSLMAHSAGSVTTQMIAFKYVMASEPYRYT